MPKRNQFVVPHSDGWAVKKEGSNRVTATFQTQSVAIEYGRDLAITQRCELVIHDRKGNVRKRRNYNHPRYAALRYEQVRAGVCLLQSFLRIANTCFRKRIEQLTLWAKVRSRWLGLGFPMFGRIRLRAFARGQE
jgi:hypothetical protein